MDIYFLQLQKCTIDIIKYIYNRNSRFFILKKKKEKKTIHFNNNHYILNRAKTSDQKEHCFEFHKRCLHQN